MLKYVGIVLVIAGTSFFVSRQYERHAQRTSCEPNPPMGNTVATPASTRRYKYAESDICQPEWHPPSWYRLFGWESLQTWGLFITLFIIADQTKQTAIAAKATAKAASEAGKQVGLMKAQIDNAKAESIESAKTTTKTLAALKRQGLSMRRQTTHLRKSAESSKISSDAALLNAQAVIASERPFIKIEVQRDIDGDSFQILATNCGKSAAEIMIHSSEWGFFKDEEGPRDDPPFYNADGYIDVYRRIVAPGDKPFVVGNPLLVKAMRQEGHALMDSVDSSEMHIFYWGRVSYVSPLTKKREDIPPYETRWCFQYVPAITAEGPILSRAGRYGYNEHT